jgi:hypothetical protein
MLSQQQQAGVLATIEPPRFPLTVVKQYCETLWLNHGKIHGQANSRVRPLLAEHNPLPPRRQGRPCEPRHSADLAQIEDGRSALGANVAFLQLGSFGQMPGWAGLAKMARLGSVGQKGARLVFPLGLPLMGKG